MATQNNIVCGITRIKAKGMQYLLINGVLIGGDVKPVEDRYQKFKLTRKNQKLFNRLNRLMRDYFNLYEEIRHQLLKLVTPIAGGPVQG